VRIRPCWKDRSRADTVSAEFRADVIAVARKGEAPLRQIAKDFGISEACLHRWLKIADREDGRGRPASPGDTNELAAQLREVHKRIKLPRAGG
jgi:transposase